MAYSIGAYQPQVKEAYMRQDFAEWVKYRAQEINLLDVDEAVILLGFTKVMVDAFDSANVDVPDWLFIQRRRLTRHIRDKQAEQLERKLSMARAKLETLKTPDEQRSELLAEINALEAKLGDGA